MRFLILLLVAAGALLVACEEKPSNQYSRAVETREQTFLRAEAAVPVPVTQNFPLREALAKMTLRQDLTAHPWYVYILAQTGNVIGYYVAQTVPVNACAFLSSTERIYYWNGGMLRMTAPSLDGIYYGGAGASSGCDAWFFFDAATDALVQIRGVNFFAADQPLRLQAEPIEVQVR